MSPEKDPDSLLRLPAVAGFFYPNEPETLRREVESKVLPPTSETSKPRALIVPHAGYRYSGQLAGRTLSHLASRSTNLVFLLGPPHFVAVRGVALPRARVFRTPLGDVPVDEAVCQDLLEDPWIEESAAAHEAEHSLEVELPFLQVLLGPFRVVPLLVGGAPPEVVARIFERYWEIPRTVFIVSSDLSHFLGYAEARRRDQRTLDRIVGLSAPDLRGEDACGFRALNGLIEFAAHRGLSPRALGLESSGDHGGGLSRVVGYGAVGFWES